VTARGIERRAVYVDERDRLHFLELLEAMVGRFLVKVHAYVLMGNHYHLILQTPEANLSRAVQWLNVSYVVWFNRRHDRVGPLLQGRFKALVVENGEWAYELSLYAHLNPVMRRSFGLDKKSKKAEGQGLKIPTSEEVARRLQELRQYRWSSYRAYAGYGKKPEWLTTREILGRAGGEEARQAARYRGDVAVRLAKGVDPGRKEAMRDTFALGSEAFREQVRRWVRYGREAAEPRGLAKRLSWEAVLERVGEVVGEAAEVFMRQRGQPGRSLALWAARRFGGMTLNEVGQVAGGMDYTAVAMAVKRLEQRIAHDRHWRALMQQVQSKCEK